VFTKTFQYQREAFAHLAMELSTNDKWLGYQPSKLYDKKREQYKYPNFFTDNRSLTDAERATLDKWIGSRPDKIFDKKRMQYTYPHDFRVDFAQIVEEIYADKWIGRYPDKLFDVVRQQYTYPYLSMDSQLLTTSENMTLDKWYREIERPRWDKKRQQHTYPREAFRVDTEKVTDLPMDSWFQEIERPLRADFRARRWPSFTVDVAALTRSENISVDKWFKELERPRFDKKRMQFVYPQIDWRVEEDVVYHFPTDDFSQYPDQVFRAKFRPYYYPVFAIDPNALTEAEKTQLDKWFREVVQPIFDKERNQHLYPVTRTDTIPPIEPTIPLESFYHYLENPVLAKFRAYYYPASHERFVAFPTCPQDWYNATNTEYTENNNTEWYTKNNTQFKSDNTQNWYTKNNTKWKEDC
jgi:hypothetical protein